MSRRTGRLESSKSVSDFDVIIVGAGVAGLAALRKLDQAGWRAIVLEARDRVGGRIYTIHDPLSPVALELGAEFIHGRPPAVWDIIRDAGLAVYDGTDASRYINQGEVERSADSWDLVGSVLQDMREAAAGGEQTVDSFLEARAYDDETRRAARAYVEGFNAADAREISIRALAQDIAAADEIEGDRVFRFPRGYDAVPLHLLRSVPDYPSKLRLNTVVESVNWARGSVSLRARNAVTGEIQTFCAGKAIVTVPLGVLQAETIAFSPEPSEILEAARRLRFGQVFRVVLRFREAFWETREDLRDAGFILSREAVFPTWWTTLSTRSTVLIGWHSGARAEGMKGCKRKEVVQQALASLSRVVKMPLEKVQGHLENAYFHDWHADPYALGAYSYVPAGALDARKQLAMPVEDTLYFAGEATEQHGQSATVHGAIASGRRAAQQIVEIAGVS
jgi:monoamine oxidase